MPDLSRTSWIRQSEDVDASRSSLRLPRMPCESSAADVRRRSCHRCSAAVISRFAISPISKLHGLSSEDPWQSRGSEPDAMRTAACLWLCFSAWAQTPQPPAPAKPEAAPADTQADASTPQSPAPDKERLITGSLDIGYRWQTGPGGNENVYRSIVDLGS